MAKLDRDETRTKDKHVSPGHTLDKNKEKQIIHQGHPLDRSPTTLRQLAHRRTARQSSHIAGKYITGGTRNDTELPQVSFATKVCLPRQSFLSRTTITRVCRDKSKPVATKKLSRQKYVCRDKHFCRDKILFVATKICLSLQTYFCRDKRRDKNDACGSSRQW